MNVSTDPWIPVVYLDGHDELVSLTRLYREAENIRDLVATPPQRIALMRLLICITQAALDGPVDEEDWLGCREGIIPRSLHYLTEHHDAFELYGEKPFLQVKSLVPIDNAALDKLDFRLASGNNATLHDHGALADGRPHSPSWVALMLVTYQSFSPGGTIGQTEWAGVSTGKNSEHAPCVEGSALHTIILGATLLDSIRLNLLSKHTVCRLPNSSWGQPVWELCLSTPQSEILNENVRSYLGRLTPVSRAVFLRADSTKFSLVNGLKYPKLPESREPMATVVERTSRGNSKLFYLACDLAKHPWRELCAVLSLGQDGEGGNLALGHLRLLNSQVIDLWVGGLAADKGKIVDTAEWILSLSSDLLHDETMRKYQKGVDLADAAAKSLGRATSVYCAKMNRENVLGQPARAHFWAGLDGAYGCLVEASTDAESRLSGDWYGVVREAMEEAYATSCPHETPRQIQAYAQGLRRLRLKKPE